MARTFTLTDGTTSVNLINTADPGIILARGGGGVMGIRPELEFASGQLVDGAALRSKRYPPQVETWTLNLKDSTHDAAIGQIQTLQRLLKKADQYQLNAWQQTPVYIQQQTTNETNARYSLVIAWSSMTLDDLFNQPFESDSEIDDFELIIVREPFWRDTAPGSMPTQIPLKINNYPWFDAETLGGSAGFEVIGGDDVIGGSWSGKITLTGAGDSVREYIYSVGGLTDITLQFTINLDNLTMASGDSFNSFPVLHGAGPGASAALLYIRDTAGTKEIALGVYDDSPAFIGTSYYALAAGDNIIKIEFHASTGAGGHNGEASLYIGGVLKETLDTIDNDQYDIDYIEFYTNGVDAGTSGYFMVDDISFDDAVPYAAAVRTIDFEETTALVVNYRDNTALSHIYNYDASLTAFSGNLVAESNFALFEVSGSTPALNDCIYFGAAAPFYGVGVNIGVGGTCSVLLTVEYWSGAAWTGITGGAMSTILTSEFTGHHMFKFSGASSWAATTINGQNKYWLRVRISTFTSWTTSPQQFGEVMFSPRSSYIELNDTQILGDVYARALIRFLNYAAITGEEIVWAAMGARSVGLDSFISRINAGGANPSGWVETYGTDTSQTADPEAPGGNNGTCTFATNQAMTARVTLTAPVASTADLRGNYHIYLRARQTAGSAGDVSVKLRVGSGAQQIGETVTLQQTDAGIELIDLGVFSIFQLGILGDELEITTTNPVTQPEFVLYAKSDNGTTPNLEVHDLILIPIDEWSIVVSYSGGALQILKNGQGFQVDNGVIRSGAIQINTATGATEEDVVQLSPFSIWEARGDLPQIEPRRNTRVYFLFGTAADSYDYILDSPASLGGGINFYPVDQWFNVRGADG